MVSIHYMAVLFCSTHSLDIVLCCKTYLGGIRGVKMFLDGFKIQHLHSKVEKLYIELHQPKLKTYADITRLLKIILVVHYHR